MRDVLDLKLLEQPEQSSCFGGTVRLQLQNDGTLLLDMARFAEDRPNV